MDYARSVAVVSGGASGLGEAFVRMLVKAGGRAAILDFDQDRGEQLASELGQGVIFCKADVTSDKDVQDAVHAAMEAFGAIHAAVNCAGVVTPAKVLGKNGPIGLDVFNQVVQINLVGTMNVLRLAAEKMMTNTPNEDGEKGVIINTASIAAFEGQIGQAAYASSKAGVVGLTLPVAREFAAYGIRVVAVAPGLFETPMIAGLPEKARTSLVNMVNFPKRLGKPFEFALLARQIIENPYLNGVTIRLDSGMTMAAR